MQVEVEIENGEEGMWRMIEGGGSSNGGSSSGRSGGSKCSGGGGWSTSVRG